MSFLTTQPLWVLALVFAGLMLLALAGPVLVRRRIGLAKLSTNNEVAGFKFATVGVLYAVLLGFAVIVVWEKYSTAEEDATREAGAIASLYRLAGGIAPEADADNLRNRVTAYAHAAIEKDWPAMMRREASPDVTRALNGLYAVADHLDAPNARQAALLTEVLHQLDTITEARRNRVNLAEGIVPGVIWLVLFGGALLTISFTFFFATENLPAQVMMTGILSALIFGGLFVIMAIDHPFAGTVRVEPHAITDVLEDFAAARAPAP